MFKDHLGKWSLSRLICALSAITGTTIAIIGALKTEFTISQVILVLGLFVIAMIGKIGSATIENGRFVVESDEEDPTVDKTVIQHSGASNLLPSEAVDCDTDTCCKKIGFDSQGKGL